MSVRKGVGTGLGAGHGDWRRYGLMVLIALARVQRREPRMSVIQSVIRASPSA
jgi:hypothetical protein